MIYTKQKHLQMSVLAIIIRVTSKIHKKNEFASPESQKRLKVEVDPIRASNQIWTEFRI